MKKKTDSLKLQVARFERAVIQTTLALSKTKTEAAATLGITTQTLRLKSRLPGRQKKNGAKEVR